MRGIYVDAGRMSRRRYSSSHSHHQISLSQRLPVSGEYYPSWANPQVGNAWQFPSARLYPPPDRAIQPALEARNGQTIKAKTRTVERSHMIMLSKASAVAAVIEQATSGDRAEDRQQGEAAIALMAMALRVS
ncbi:hypothetical protein [Mesorhizobium sp. B2-4-15]|uniref:hypothetical protein n=1 Tax=Mesorhizobium sp. B2-4-15 TaxID=2589934 RepID=UPI001FEF8410|nr:hypothetical protein [Mesorhizobium sp. B2-4-15]